MFQQVTLIGYLGSDPEMRYTPSGVPVTQFSLATSKKWTGQDGQPHEQTIWWRVQCWRKSAEIASQYLVKGKQVFVQGELSPPTAYIDREGKPRSSFDVQATLLKFLGGAGGNQQIVAGEGGEQAGGDSASNEEIPF